MHRKIAAGIVLYNPEDEERVQKSIKSIFEQVDKVYVFDNSTDRNKIVFPGNVTYISEGKNMGVAYALNRIMEKSKIDGYEWLMTMDQDSILPKGIIMAYEKYLSDETIGIICPQVIDSRRSYMEVKKNPKEEYIDFCITSASCTKIDVWEKVGRFDEWLFIDLIDNDFCKRIKASGYEILRLNELVLDQEFGKITPKSKQIQTFWNKIAKLLNNENFAKLGYYKFVSPMRVYYTNRNIIYINKKLRNYSSTWYKENYNCKSYPGFLINFVLPSIFRAQKKKKVIKAVITGIRDGRKAKPDIWIAGN